MSSVLSAASASTSPPAFTFTSSSSSSFSPSSPSVLPFPHTGLLPKLETQSPTFLSSRPTCDGRGVLVAIFDTGVDPAAPGLRVTTDGKPKLLSVWDCSGSGDVDVSEERTAASAGEGEGAEVETLSGRRVQVAALGARDGRFRVGVKRAYELFPEPLVARLKKGRRKRWDEAQRQLETALHRAVQEAEEGSKERADVELRYNEVKAMAKAYEDPGPVYDVLVYRAADDDWTAVVVSEDAEGHQHVGKPLRPYEQHLEWDTFSGDDLMNYTVSLDLPSSTATIVVQAGSHGTHVAGIVAAHFPDQPDLNGQAPGAQLVSVKIGDSRLGSMETGVGLMRGLIVALRCKVDLINMSYGEASAQCDVGRFPDGVRELINKHGIMFVCSAGNSGPALTTAGSPGSTTSDIIGVGAYVSPAMMLASYSLRSALQATQYTWSSRGPSADGALGVCISAPGGAITSVPTWTLQGLQLLHGTSMSSPSATSAIALLLSACKQHGVRYTPHRLRKAIENTAAPVPGLDPLTVGCGLLQVEDAYQWLEKFSAYDDLDVALRVTVGGFGRGVYLREKDDVNRRQELTITIEPSFFEPDDDADSLHPPTKPDVQTNGDTPTDAATSHSPRKERTPSADSTAYQRNQLKVSFQLRVALLNAATSWVDCPSHLMLMHGGRSFTICVHPQRLTPGLHHTQLLGVDSAAPERGPLFRVPITVLVPERPQATGGGEEAVPPLSLLDGGVLDNVQDGEEIDQSIIPSFPTPLVSFSTTPRHQHASTQSSFSSPLPPPPVLGIDYRFAGLSFSPGAIVRRFVLIPDHATWVEFRLRGHGIATTRAFMFHVVFLLPDTPFRDHELNKYFSLTDEEDVRWSMDVVGGRTLELCLAQYWNADGDCTVDLDASFHSIAVNAGEQSVTLDGNVGLHRLDVSTPLRTEALNPVVTLKDVQVPVRPTSSHLSALTALDVLPGSRQVYQLVLGYAWEVKEESAKVTCLFPLLQGVLYESVYESQLFMLFDASKRLLGSGDAWPKDLTLKRGRYTTRIQVRHDDIAMLERLKEQLLLLDFALPKPIDLPVYHTRNAALQAGTKFGDRRVSKAGQRRAMWLLAPDMKALPAWVKAGDVLVGNIALNKGNGGGGSNKSGAINLKLSVPPLIPTEKRDAAKKDGGAEKKPKDAAAKDDAEVKAKAEDKLPTNDPAVKPAPRDDVDQKKQLEEVRPAVTEEDKEVKDHAMGAINVTIGEFERKGEGEADDGKGEEPGRSGEGKEIEEEVRDLQIDYVAGLKGKKKQAAFAQLFPALIERYPGHLPLLVLRAETVYDAFTTSQPSASSAASASLPSSSSPSSATASLQKVVDACDAVVQSVDATAVAAHFGRVLDKDSPEQAKARKAFDKQRDALITALSLKLQALKTVGLTSSTTSADYERVYADLASWVDPQGTKEAKKKYSALTAEWYRLKGRLGAGLKQLNAAMAEAGAGEVTVDLYDERLAMLRAMVDDTQLVEHWVQYEKAWNVARFPRDFTRF